jgi:hypothetical protein
MHCLRNVWRGVDSSCDALPGIGWPIVHTQIRIFDAKGKPIAREAASRRSKELFNVALSAALAGRGSIPVSALRVADCPGLEMKGGRVWKSFGSYC